MIAVLEPISTGDVIDRAVRLYRRNFGAFVLLIGLPGLISYAASLMAGFGYLGVIRESNPLSDVGNLILTVVGYFITYFISPLLYLLSAAAMARASADHVMLGTPIGFRRSMQLLREKFSQLLLTWLLLMAILVGATLLAYFLLTALILLVAFLFTALRGAPSWLVGTVMTAVIALGLGGTILLLLSLASRICFIPQIVMIEGLSAGDALKRSFRLGSRNWFRLGGILLFYYFVVLSIISAIMVPVGVYLYVNRTLTSMNTWEAITWFTLLYSTASQFSTIHTMPILIISLTLLYFDTRVRKEAYDLELLLRQAGLASRRLSSASASGRAEETGSTGGQLATRCAACGKVSEVPGAGFCMDCGASLNVSVISAEANPTGASLP